MTTSIKLLPEHLIDQIKAGEVIERPSNLIKEILENSIDAGASEINLSIIDNGLELIALEDNGHGMTFDELPYAFCRHATSKISSFEDLYRLQTYGFRGEALASIASIAKVSCSSSKKFQEGGKIEIQGGQTISHIKTESTVQGTSLFIKELFYNTPVRLKFIKSKTTERNNLKKIINAFLLSTPQISFRINWDDEKETYPATEDKIRRITQIFYGKQKQNTSVKVTNGEYSEYHCELYFSEQSSNSHQKTQALFVNGRLFEDRQIHAALIRQLELFWKQESGHYALFLQVPAKEIDVNVHPGKTQVKFSDNGIIFSLIKAVVEKMEIKATSPVHKLEHEFSSLPFQQITPTTFESFQGLSETFRPSTPPTNNSLNESRKIISLGENFSIMLGEQNILLDNKKIFTAFLINKLKEKNQLTEAETLPLFIGRPHRIKQSEINSKILIQLSLAGFENDRLDQEMVVLRSIPQYLSIVNSYDFFPSLIEVLAGQIKSVTTFPLQISNFEIILNTFNMPFLVEQKMATFINDNHLSKILSGA